MKKLAPFVALFLLLAPVPAMAYIDPGSGSAIMSAIIGFFVAAALIVKTYWYKLTGIFCKKAAADENSEKNV